MQTRLGWGPSSARFGWRSGWLFERGSQVALVQVSLVYMRREKEYEPSREQTDRMPECAVMSGYVGKRGHGYILDMFYDYCGQRTCSPDRRAVRQTDSAKV